MLIILEIKLVCSIFHCFLYRRLQVAHDDHLQSCFAGDPLIECAI